MKTAVIKLNRNEFYLLSAAVANFSEHAQDCDQCIKISDELDQLMKTLFTQVNKQSNWCARVELENELPKMGKH
jgi:hypothetical protein